MTEDCMYFDEPSSNDDGYCNHRGRFTYDEGCDGCPRWVTPPSEDWGRCAWDGTLIPKSECDGCKFYNYGKKTNP
jgi:hypothetical protein